MKYRVIAARKAHIESILKLCRKAFRDCPDGHLEFDNDKARGAITECVLNTHYFAIVAINKQGNVRGLWLAHVAPHMCAKGLVASDLAIYVHPELRGTPVTEEMLSHYVAWCDQIKGLTVSGISLSQLGPTTPFMESLFKKYGYSLGGKEYIRCLK